MTRFSRKNRRYWCIRRAPVLAAALAAVIYLLAGWQLSAFPSTPRGR
jgi:hypothetical protein